MIIKRSLIQREDPRFATEEELRLFINDFKASKGSHLFFFLSIFDTFPNTNSKLIFNNCN